MTQNHNIDRRKLLGGAALAASAAAAPALATKTEAALNLAGKRVLITGASSGFGHLSALHFARLGADVVASMRNLQGGKRPEAQALLDAASKEKFKIRVIEIDVTRDDQTSAGVAAAETMTGGALDAVLNNAGIGVGGPVELYDAAQLQRAFDVNFFGYHRIARAALPKMRARGEGLLLFVSSQLGRLILPNIGVYCGTKFAVEGMFEALAYEIAPFGVEVTIIEPGGYPTQIWKNGARYFEEMMAAADDARKAAYAGHIEASQGMFSNGGTTDPMDVPRAIAEVIATQKGKRPLRRAVHPNTQATDALNAAHRQVQSAVLGQGRYKTWHDAVAD